MSKEIEIDRKKLVRITRSYEEKIPHSLHGGPRYAMSGLFCSYSAEVDADTSNKEQQELSEKLHQKAKKDLNKTKKEIIRRIKNRGEEPTDPQKKYIRDLAAQTGEAIPDIESDEFTKNDAKKLIPKLENKKKEQSKEQQKKDETKEKESQQEIDNFIPEEN